MKILMAAAMLFICATCSAQQPITVELNPYIIADIGGAYRTTTIKGPLLETDGQKKTAVLNINGGYNAHFESARGFFDMLAEINVKLPLVDGFNVTRIGIQTGAIIHCGNMGLVPMIGGWYGFGSAEPASFKAGVTLKAIFNAPKKDTNWHIEASYTHNIIGLGIGLVISKNKLVEAVL